MAGVLSLNQWLGGPDNILAESTFPSSEKTYAYQFNQNITGWSFSLQSQTIIVDAIAYDRITGAPNYANSNVIGYFPSIQISTSTYIQVANTATGIVNVTHPANQYTGPILPDARANIPMEIVSLTFSDNTTPKQINSHRMAKILAWEPGVVPGDPTQASVTTTVVGWTPHGSNPTLLFVANSFGIVSGSTFTINTSTYTVTTVSTSKQIGMTPNINYADLSVGLPVTFFNNNSFYSLV
jgi:hypothetical protein